MEKKKQVVATVPLEVMDRRLTDALVEAYTHKMGVRIVGRAYDTIPERIVEGVNNGTLVGTYNRAKSAQHVGHHVE